MRWVKMGREIATVAIVGMVVVAGIPLNARSQQRSSLEGRAGVAVPSGRLARLADPGPNVGLQLAYPVGDRVALDLRGDVDMLQGTRLSSQKAPNVRLWRYGAGIETRILPVRASRWALMADLGVGATTMDTDEFASPGDQSRRDFTETYFTSGAGIRLEYEVNSRVSTHVGAGAHWANTNPNETRALQELDPTQVRQFSSAVERSSDDGCQGEDWLPSGCGAAFCTARPRCLTGEQAPHTRRWARPGTPGRDSDPAGACPLRLRPLRDKA